jgi:hypothetical protein
MDTRRKLVVAGGMSLAALAVGGEAVSLRALDSARTAGQEKQIVTAQSKFYCNSKALRPEERARHKQLTDKLTSMRKEVVETEKGYEFQYSPSDVSLLELADWVVAEGKCCPFFDFHIDLEQEGTLLCLRLTGTDGIKAFIRSEFPLAAK